MNSLIDAAMSRSRTVLTFMVISVVAGILSYINIPKEADPDVPIPYVMVQIPYDGVSPEDAERLLVKPMEVQLKTIEGLEEMESYGAQGHAGVFLEFDVNMDMEQVLLDVREKVDQAKAKLPQEAEEPIVMEFNAGLFPVIVVTLSGEVPERYLNQLSREAKDAIEALPTILEVDLVGRREDLLEVIIDPAKLESHAISQQELLNAVRLNNRLIPAGALDTGAGSFNVKVPGLFETAADVYNLPVKVSGDGVVTLSDVAEIRRTFKDRERYSSVDGNTAIGMMVTKRIGSNIIETNQAVRDVMTDLSQNWPSTVRVHYVLDQSKWIFGTLDSLEGSIMTAIILVMIVVVAALGFRSATLVGIAIPSSFMIGFLLLGMAGLTVNMMVMFGMVLSVGILVDGAIVVVEYADRKMAEGLNRYDAYNMAAKRMFWPIISSTGTTLAAFLPMLFWPGIIGKFMMYFPFTLIFVLSASLVMALIFLPVLGSLFGKTLAVKKDTLKALAATESGDITDLPGFTGAYARFIDRVIKTPGRYLAGSFAGMAMIVIAFWVTGVKTQYFIDIPPEQAMAYISARGNYSVEERFTFIKSVEKIVMEVDGVKTAFMSTGGGGPAFGNSAPSDAIGRIFIEFENWRVRRDGYEILEDLRQRTNDLPGIGVTVAEMEQGPSQGKDIQLEVRSDYLSLIGPTIAQLRYHLEEEMEGIVDIDDSRPLPGIEYQISVDREQAGLFGADIVSVGSYVQLITNGILVGKYRPDDADDEVDIRARFPLEYRNFDQLDQLRVQTPNGPVPISNFVSIQPKPKVDRVTRVNGKRYMSLTANVDAGLNANEQIAKVQKWLETDSGIDPRVQVVFRGSTEDQKEVVVFLVTAIFVSLFLMAMILITQFNSFYHAILILSSVVLSVVGVLLGLMITGQKFSFVMTGTGVVALAGIVVNNNIVLIDTYQRLRASGFEIAEAIVRTSTQRLRPIMLTTGTTVFGLLPMAAGLSINFFSREVTMANPISHWWVQMSSAVVFGLTFSTVLTLFLTPCLLILPAKLKGSFGGIRATTKGYLIRYLMKSADAPRLTNEGPREVPKPGGSAEAAE